MNATLKTILLTVLTLSLFTLAMVEISGVSKTAVINKWKGTEITPAEGSSISEQIDRDKKVKEMPKTTFEFDATKHDFGAMQEGDTAAHIYKFKNTGNAPLLVSNVQTSCGCTVPSFSKEPISPGDTGELKLVFNSAGKPGDVVKTALMTCNSESSPYSIGFTAKVAPKK
jgi:hypothetical protein